VAAHGGCGPRLPPARRPRPARSCSESAASRRRGYRPTRLGRAPARTPASHPTSPAAVSHGHSLRRSSLQPDGREGRGGGGGKPIARGAAGAPGQGGGRGCTRWLQNCRRSAASSWLASSSASTRSVGASADRPSSAAASSSSATCPALRVSLTPCPHLARRLASRGGHSILLRSPFLPPVTCYWILRVDERGARDNGITASPWPARPPACRGRPARPRAP
jgi:hypothetical protein